MSSSEVGLLRLVAQHLAGPPAATAGDAVRRLGCVQAQDLPGATTSIALRTAGGDRASVRAAFDSGEIVRSWPMRGTLHVVPAEDLGRMLGLGTPRSLAAAAQRRAHLGLTDADIDRARDLALAAGPATRDDLMAAWAELSPEKGRGYHLLARLAETGVLCFGPTRRDDDTAGDGEPLIVAVDDWITAPRELEREESLGEWARRFFRGHGPASAADFARWTSMPAADVRAGIALARPDLESMSVDGVEHLLDPEVPARLAEHRRDARGVRLLPAFDEFVLGYGVRTAVLDATHAERIGPGRNGVFRPTVVAGGRIVGIWRTARGKLTVEALDPDGTLAPRVLAAAERAYDRLPR